MPNSVKIAADKFNTLYDESAQDQFRKKLLMTEKPQQQGAEIELCRELAILIDRLTHAQGNGIHSTAISQLEFVRENAASSPTHGLYNPVLCIVVQGAKEVSPNKKSYVCSAARYLVISVDLPMNGFTVEATAENPYLALTLSLDLAEICDIIAQTGYRVKKKKTSMLGISISNADTFLLNAALRLTSLLDTPKDISFLAPIIIREIYYRLLIGEQGNAIFQLATSGSHMQRIAETIRSIKENVEQPLQLEDLAEQAHMSLSSFHRHFKAITSLSPLQYQKRLRLLKARQLMLTRNTDATRAAFEVGYGSPSQFSREYSRMFGAPPHRDIKSNRTSL
ncbi:MAG: AraC family transcriptional regulator [Cyanobacteria bacterium P01_C01_bin.121]